MQCLMKYIPRDFFFFKGGVSKKLVLWCHSVTIKAYWIVHFFFII